MRIAIIGAGNVGGTLGRRWAEKHHEVVFGVRVPDDDKTNSLIDSIRGKAGATTIESAARDADVIALTVPWNAVEGVIAQLGDLAGKIILDCTNPAFFDKHDSDISGGEHVARWARGARVEKIFNTIGFEGMADPRFGAEQATMFYAGDEAEAKQVAARLAADINFDPVDAGALANARLLEGLTQLWATLAYKQGMGRGLAFRLLKR